MKRAVNSCDLLPKTFMRGFSLVEVLVALVIIGVGMLGLAKIEVLAYASTSTASQRSIAALEAASLAAAMHSNRNYWSATPANLSITVAGTTITPTDAALSGTTKCNVVGTPCGAPALAAYDLLQWVTDLNAALPNPTGTVSCPTPVSGPVNCTIQVSWTENQTGINSQSQGNSMAASVYTLYVVP
jgi:type IV pilus assembly protein PilV